MRNLRNFLIYFQFATPRKRRKESHNPGGGYTKFLTSYAAKYQNETIEASNKGSSSAFCKACDQHFKLLKGGEAKIKNHLNTKKHQEKLADYRKNVPFEQFVKRRTVFFNFKKLII